MGELNQHDLTPYIDKYGCRVFVETGTGIGTGLGHAKKYPFEALYSCEINKELALKSRRKFYGDDRIIILEEPSIKFLEWAAPLIKRPCLFWLDAHFPGADFQLGSYDDEHPEPIKYPLLHELNIIFDARPESRDVFIMDDLQLYEDGNYELKIKPEFIAKHRRPIEPILDILKHTHNMRRDYRHQGFLIAEPK